MNIIKKNISKRLNKILCNENNIELIQFPIYDIQFDKFISQDFEQNEIKKLRISYKNIVPDYKNIPDILNPTDTDLYIMKEMIKQNDKINILNYLYNDIADLYIPNKTCIDKNFILPNLNNLILVGFDIKITCNKDNHLKLNIFEQTIYIYPIQKCILNIDALSSNITKNNFISYICYLKSFSYIIKTIDDYEFSVRKKIIPKIGYLTWLNIRTKINKLPDYCYTDKKIEYFIVFIQIWNILTPYYIFLPFLTSSINIPSSANKFWQFSLAILLLLTTFLTLSQIIMVGFPNVAFIFTLITSILTAIIYYSIFSFYIKYIIFNFIYMPLHLFYLIIMIFLHYPKKVNISDK